MSVLIGNVNLHWLGIFLITCPKWCPWRVRCTRCLSEFLRSTTKNKNFHKVKPYWCHSCERISLEINSQSGAYLFIQFSLQVSWLCCILCEKCGNSRLNIPWLTSFPLKAWYIRLFYYIYITNLFHEYQYNVHMEDFWHLSWCILVI